MMHHSPLLVAGFDVNWYDCCWLGCTFCAVICWVLCDVIYVSSSSSSSIPISLPLSLTLLFKLSEASLIDSWHWVIPPWLASAIQNSGTLFSCNLLSVLPLIPTLYDLASPIHHKTVFLTNRYICKHPPKNKFDCSCWKRFLLQKESKTLFSCSLLTKTTNILTVITLHGKPIHNKAMTAFPWWSKILSPLFVRMILVDRWII